MASSKTQPSTPSIPWVPYEMKGATNIITRFETYRKKYGWMYTYPLQRRYGATKYSVGEVFIIFPLMTLIIAVFCYLFAQRDDGVGGTGGLASAWMGIAILLGSHNSVFSFLLGMPFERGIAYHIRFARVSIIMGLMHGIWPVIDYASGGMEDDELGVFQSGLAFGGAIALIWFTSLFRIRRKFFETFYKAHVILVLAVFGAAIAHGAACKYIGG